MEATQTKAKAPYVEQDVGEITTLVNGLESHKGGKRKGGFSCKKTSFDVAGSDISVDSWRFQDWDYKRRDLPTYARGLFTTKNRRNQPEIAVRGYDKFFNIGEVNETQWENILERTAGPYELTLKENGCIIFISGLEDGTLLVCSKHSTGDRGDVEVSHASAGNRWINRQLQALGKAREDLAQALYARNITAVAELCDDEFEEHILAYGPDKAGLYLHGVNLNVPIFMTYPSDTVQQFADEWGFRKVGLQVFDDINEVKIFLDGVAETGAHEGRDVEGFVVRCKMSPKPGSIPFTDWFFKYKFEEPYLMYRQWRECTKALISGKPPKYKKHVKITEEYLQYARKRLATDPKLGKLYNQNHGIIALRDDFLKFKNLKGSDAANWEAEFGADDSTLVDSNVVLVPVATIGCGKTTIAVALTHLFGWGHVQNDNIQGKNRPVRMVQAVMQQLAERPVVISDRNNAERREREQIIRDIKLQNKDARLIALSFSHGNVDEVRRITRERVLARGDNHQTIQAASDRNKVVGIMENFIGRFQPCEPEMAPDDGFDLVIDLDPTLESRINTETVVRQIHEKFPRLIPDVPSSEDIDEAVKAALEDYKPDLRHTIPDRGPRKDKQVDQKLGEMKAQEARPAKKKPLEYMAISVPADETRSLLDRSFQNLDPENARFYNQLRKTRRVQPGFHVTLQHRATSKEHPELWQKYSSLHAESQAVDGRLADCDVQLERVVYDDRIMAIIVRILDEQWTCVNKVAHITIGTRDDTVKPKESNDLLARWLEVGSGGETGLREQSFENKPVLKGVVRGVLSR